MTAWYFMRSGPGWEVHYQYGRVSGTYDLRLKSTVDGKTHFIRTKDVPSEVIMEMVPSDCYTLGIERKPMSDLALLDFFRACASVDGKDTRWMKELIL